MAIFYCSTYSDVHPRMAIHTLPISLVRVSVDDTVTLTSLVHPQMAIHTHTAYPLSEYPWMTEHSLPTRLGKAPQVSVWNCNSLYTETYVHVHAPYTETYVHALYTETYVHALYTETYVHTLYTETYVHELPLVC